VSGADSAGKLAKPEVNRRCSRGNPRRDLIGTQVCTAIVYLIAMLAVVDIILVSYLAAPAKAQAALRLQHDWVSAHRRQVQIAVFTVDGFASLAHGIRRI
jgi:hypothetical protein